MWFLFLHHHLQANPQLFRNPYKATRDILLAAKAALKALPAVKIAPVEATVGGHGAGMEGQGDQGDVREGQGGHGAVQENQGEGEGGQGVRKEDQVDGKDEHSYALAHPPSPAMEVSVGNFDDISMQGNCSSELTQSSKPKKAKLLDDLFAVDDNVLGLSPVLQHKLPARPVSDQESEDVDEEKKVHTNLFGVNFVMWFDVGIEGKSSMDQDEEDWGGRLEFGFSENNFPKGSLQKK